MTSVKSDTGQVHGSAGPRSPPCYLRGFSELAMLWIMDRPTLVTGHSLPWLQSGCHTGQSGCVRSPASLAGAQGSDLLERVPSLGELLVTATSLTQLWWVTADDRPAARLPPAVTWVCPAWRPNPCPSALSSLVRGVLPLPAQNIARSFPRVQDQRLLLCAVPAQTGNRPRHCVVGSGHWLWAPSWSDS